MEDKNFDIVPVIKKITVKKLIIALWLFIPVFIGIWCIVMGLCGNFVPQEKNVDSWVYYKTIDFYRISVIILGGVSILYSVTVILRSDVIRVLRQLWIMAFAVLLMWSMLSTLLSDDPIGQIGGSDVIFDGLYTYFIYAAVFITGLTITSEESRKKILNIFTAVVSFLSVIMLAQESRNDFIVYCFPTIKSSVFQNSNYFGYILCISDIALFGLYIFERCEWKRRLYLAGFCCQFMVLLVNNTFGCYLAVCAALGFTCIVYKKNGRVWEKRFWVPIIFWFVASVIHFSFFSPDIKKLFMDVNDIMLDSQHAGSAGSGRWVLWCDAIERIKAHPIVGWGPEGFNEQGSFGTWGSPHNDLLQIAGYLGIPGVIMYLIALVSLAVSKWREIRQLKEMELILSGIVVCYLASAEFGHPVYNTTPYFWLFLGMLCSTVSGHPALTIESDNVNRGKKSYLLISGFALYVILCAIGCYYRQAVKIENTNEQADLLAMYSAEMTIKVQLKNNQLPDGEYWYDANTLTLIPVGMTAPAPYGVGTSRNGKGKETFEEQYQLYYDYDEKSDYTDAVIKAAVTSDEGNKNEIHLEWIRVSQ